MCGCDKKKSVTVKPFSYNDKRQVGALVASGEVVYVQYNGFQPTVTRRGPVTNYRYIASFGQTCVPMYAVDFEALKDRIVRKGSVSRVEWLVCKEQEVVIETKSAVEVAQAMDAAESTPQAEPQTESHIADITSMTVAEALPIIREAAAHTLDVWYVQESNRDGGARQTIMAAIEKRRAEIVVEQGQG